MSREAYLAIAGAIFLFSAAAAGCGAKDESAPSKPTAPVSQAAPASTPAATSAPISASVPASSSVPLAATDGDIPGIRVAVNELKRSPSAVTLKFTLYNDTDAEFDISGKFDENPYKGYRNFGGVHLVDTGSKKKYFAIADSENKCVCSDDVPAMAKKSSIALWVKFPPMPDDVQKITVQVPHFIPMDDVPITR